MYFGRLMATLDIILPAYNPLPGWEDLVIGRMLSLENQMPALQMGLIIINDGSSKIIEKDCVEKIKNAIAGLQWINYGQNRGKGHALRQGVGVSEADLILYTDIDWPYTEESMLLVIDELLKDAHAVIGVRDDSYYDQLPPGRRRISKWLRKINAGLLRLKVDDTQAGLKAFRKNVKDIFLKTTINRYLFDLEFIYLLSKKSDAVVTGIPITLRKGITFSKMNKKILWQEARNFLKIWIKS